MPKFTVKAHETITEITEDDNNNKFSVRTRADINATLMKLEGINSHSYRQLYDLLHADDDGYLWCMRCKCCQQWTVSNRSDALFCNDACRKSYKRGILYFTKRCPVCRKLVKTTGKRVYCSQRCQMRAYRARKKARMLDGCIDGKLHLKKFVQNRLTIK